MSHGDILDELPDVLGNIMGVTRLGQVNFLLFDGAHQSLGIAMLIWALSSSLVNVVKSGILDALVGGTCLEGTGRPRRSGTYVTCSGRAWPFRTAGGRWAGRPGSLPPAGWTAIPPGRALRPGRWRGTAACPGR